MGFASNLASGLIIGGINGDLSLDHLLMNAAIAGVTASAFNVVGDLTGHVPAFGTPEYLKNVAGHALVGCGSAAASGESCASGALSGAVGSALTPLTPYLLSGIDSDTGRLLGGTLIMGGVGGLSSIAAGGDFAQGAMTAALGYIYNAAFGKGRLQHILDRHGVGAQLKDRQAGEFTPEYANTQGLNDLADDILAQPGGTIPGNRLIPSLHLVLSGYKTITRGLQCHIPLEFPANGLMVLVGYPPISP